MTGALTSRQDGASESNDGERIWIHNGIFIIVRDIIDNSDSLTRYVNEISSIEDRRRSPWTFEIRRRLTHQWRGNDIIEILDNGSATAVFADYAGVHAVDPTAVIEIGFRISGILQWTFDIYRFCGSACSNNLTVLASRNVRIIRFAMPRWERSLVLKWWKLGDQIARAFAMPRNILCLRLISARQCTSIRWAQRGKMRIESLCTRVSWRFSPLALVSLCRISERRTDFLSLFPFFPFSFERGNCGVLIWEVTGKWKSAWQEHKAEKGLTSRSRHRFKIGREAQLLILPSMDGLRDCNSESEEERKGRKKGRKRKEEEDHCRSSSSSTSDMCDVIKLWSAKLSFPPVHSSQSFPHEDWRARYSHYFRISPLCLVGFSCSLSLLAETFIAPRLILKFYYNRRSRVNSVKLISVLSDDCFVSRLTWQQRHDECSKTRSM